MSTEDKDDKTKGKGSAGSVGTGGRGSASGGGAKSPPPMSSAFFEVMREKGVSSEQIAKIITDWAHHTGSQLTERVKQFIEGVQKATDPVSRASAHLVVSFSNMGFALISNLLSYMTAEMVEELDRKMRATQTAKPHFTRT